MYIEQLEYVIEVAKKGSISNAAESLHVSHSAISQAISSLEMELGMIIFKRSRAGCICTTEGKIVLNLSNQIMNKILQLKDLVPSSNSMKRNLSIASSPIFFTTFLPAVLHEFKEKHPNVQLKIDENSTESIIEAVKNQEADLGLIFGSDETLNSVSTNLATSSLYQPKMKVAVSRLSPLAMNRVVYPDEILQYPLVIRNEKFSKNIWKEFFNKYGQGEVLFYSNNDGVIKNVIANGLAIGFLPDLMQHDPLIENGDIITIPYNSEHDIPSLHLICIQAKNKYSSAIEKEFVECLKMKLDSYLMREPEYISN